MAATRDLTSRENCFNKSSWGNISYYDGFESHTSTNPLLRKGRVGSSPTAATTRKSLDEGEIKRFLQVRIVKVRTGYWL